MEYTVADIEAMPEEQRAELIDGYLYMQAAPSRMHQDVLMFLSLEIGNYIRERHGKCKIYPAPFAVYLNKDNKNYLEPDISVICDRNKLDEKGCHGAPDWIIEIVSPSTKRMDYLIKLLKYQNSGVKEYWVVDPQEQRIWVYKFDGEGDVEHYTFQDKVKAGIYEELEIDFSKIEL